MFNKNWFLVQAPLYFPNEAAGGLEDTQVDDIENPDDEDNGDEGLEDKEGEEDKDDEDEEDDKEVALTRVEFKDVKEKFPNLFKEFPALREAFFREQQFTQMFPTVEDAQKALQIQEAYEEITSSVVSGDAQKFLTELSNEDAGGVKKFARNFLPALSKLSNDIYIDVISPVVKQQLRNVLKHGKTLENEDDRKNVIAASKIVNKVLFNVDYDEIEKGDDASLTPKASKEEEEFEKTKQQEMSRRYNSLYKEVVDVCYSKLDEEIERGLSDLKDKPGLKKIIAKAIKEQVNEAMEKDSAHMSRMQGLWKREQRQGFSGTLKSSFVTTFLGKAKTIIPKVRAEVRKEALGKEDKKNDKEPTRIGGGREAKGKGERMTPEKARKEGLSARQIFDS